MPAPARNTLAIVGAGPIGLECALAAHDAGFDVHVFERGEVAAHLLAWGHVRMFTPWRMNVGPHSRAHLEQAGWSAPDPERCPTGAELVSQALAPIAALPALANRIHRFAQVVHISRHATLQGDSDRDGRRAQQPFRLLVRDQGGRENFIQAFHVIDASGVYGQPNWAGDGGIPARQELYLAPQMSYHPDDVRGLRRERYAGKRTLVIGAGASAANTVGELAALADEVPGTAVTWVTRGAASTIYPASVADVLPERRAMAERARALAHGAHVAVTHVGEANVEGFEFNSATHRYRVRLVIGDTTRLEEADHVIVNTGFAPDDTLHRELQVPVCPRTRAVAALADALGAAGDCLDHRAFGGEVLVLPEPGFYLVGHKSYGRHGGFLLETAYRHANDVVAHAARALAASGAPA